MLQKGCPMLEYEAMKHLFKFMNMPHWTNKHWWDNSRWLIAKYLQKHVMNKARKILSAAKYLVIRWQSCGNVWKYLPSSRAIFKNGSRLLNWQQFKSMTPWKMNVLPQQVPSSSLHCEIGCLTILQLALECLATNLYGFSIWCCVWWVACT